MPSDPILSLKSSAAGSTDQGACSPHAELWSHEWCAVWGVSCVSAYIEELSETCRLLLSFGQLPRGLAVGGHVLGIDLEEESLEYGQ